MVPVSQMGEFVSLTLLYSKVNIDPKSNTERLLMKSTFALETGDRHYLSLFSDVL